jgi:hypothetical protein
MLKFGDILRISNLGEFPEEWLKVNSIVNIQITDLVTGGEKLIGVHNHLLSLPIFFGFWGIVLLTLLIVYFIRVYRHFHREPGFIFIFCSLILNMLFHNDGILNMPIYFSLLYVLYYDVNQTIKSREPGENKSFQ